MAKIISEKQDLAYLQWAHARSSSGTAGTFLKSQSVLGGVKRYYKLSDFDQEKGIIGHESVNEIIVDRLLTLLEVPHLEYTLINADIEIEGKRHCTWLCASEDFKVPGENKVALDDYFRVNAEPSESHYEFCKRMGWQEYIDRMLVIDFLILNRDRHGANIEVLRNSRVHTLRPAPLFDHGLSLLFSCHSDSEAEEFDIMKDIPCNNFIGSRSCMENLKLIEESRELFSHELREEDRGYIFEGLEDVLSKTFADRIWTMIYERYKVYENL